MERLKVAYWNNIPAPYMVDRFNAIADLGTIDFEAWFTERSEPDRSWSIDESDWRFKYRFLPGVSIGGRRLALPAPLFSKGRPDVLAMFYGGASYVLGFALARQLGVRTALWTEITSDLWFKRTRLKEVTKRYIFGRSDAALVVGDQSKALAMKYGLAAERCLLIPYDTNVDLFSSGRDAALPRRDELRAELGLKGVTFVYAGRMWWGKGVHYLLDAFKQLQASTREEVSLLMLGDGSDEEELKRRCRDEKIDNVIFAGFFQREELPAYLAASDVKVFPTLGEPYGCIVMETMACSLPVISTSAAGEIDQRIKDGVNGYIVPPQDSAALCAAMKRLAEMPPDLREAMGQASRKWVEGRTPDRWARDFVSAMYVAAGKVTPAQRQAMGEELPPVRL